jgi:hypothetical protein
MLTACSPNIYIPSPTNIPLPGNKSELKIGGSLGTAGLNFEGSYAIDTHIVILADYAFNNSTDSNTYSNNNYGEIGGGYYTKFDEHGRFELLGTVGLGSVSANQFYKGFNIGGPPPLYRYIVSNENYNKFSLQGDIGMTRKIIEIGFSAKFSFISMPNITYHKQDVGYYGGYHVYSDTSLSIANNEFFFEPCYYINLGIKNVKLHFCEGLSFPMSSNNELWLFNNLDTRFFVAFGLTIDLFRKD